MDKNLTELIRFKTYYGFLDKQSEIQKLYEYVLGNIPGKYKFKFITSNNQKSLVIYSKSLKSPKVLLQSHVDVVPGPDRLFQPVKKGNKLYGRGSSDMKFAVACYIKLLNELVNEDLDLAVWLTPDEEIGGFDGVSHLLNHQRFLPKICFLPDGVNNFSLVTRAKGVLHCRISAKGKSAHGSTPWLGVNAIDELIKAYIEIKNTNLFDSASGWNNSINFGQISGGDSTNTVPNQAYGFFDIRFIDEDNFQRIYKLFSNVQKKLNVKIDVIVKGSAFDLNEENEQIKLFKQILKENHVNYKLSEDHGSSDARFFVDNKIDVIMFKPVCSGDHSETEWIDLDSLEKFYNILRSFVKRAA